MTTTIQVNDDTIHYLKLLREQYKEPSYDSLLKKLIAKSMVPKRSMYGSVKGISMKDVMKDLRDKSDKP